MVMTHTHAKNQRQKSTSSKGRIKTNGQTDTTDFITFLPSAISNKKSTLQLAVVSMLYMVKSFLGFFLFYVSSVFTHAESFDDYIPFHFVPSFYLLAYLYASCLRLQKNHGKKLAK